MDVCASSSDSWDGGGMYSSIMGRRGEGMSKCSKAFFVLAAIVTIHIASDESSLCGAVDRLIQFTLAYCMLAHVFGQEDK